LNDECNGLSNRIEEPDTKIEKNWQKSKSTFLTFLGSAVLAGAVALFFKKKNSYTFFF
jgi:LPXTG-motif cell wall-anchored protein